MDRFVRREGREDFLLEISTLVRPCEAEIGQSAVIDQSHTSVDFVFFNVDYGLREHAEANRRLRLETVN